MRIERPHSQFAGCGTFRLGTDVAPKQPAVSPESTTTVCVAASIESTSLVCEELPLYPASINACSMPRHAEHISTS